MALTHALVGMLNWEFDRVYKWVNGRCDEDVVCEMLAWDEDSAPIAAGRLAKILPEVRTIERRMRVTPWVNRWTEVAAERKRVLEFHQGASMLEYEVVCEHNPFYLQGAFGFSFEACEDLARLLGLVVSREALMYAVAFKAIADSGQLRSVPTKEVHALLEQRMLPVANVENLIPFPLELLQNHPLHGIDLDKTAPADLAKLVPIGSMRVSRIREWRWMQNRIVMFEDDYMWASPTVAFAAEIRRRMRIKVH